MNKKAPLKKILSISLITVLLMNSTACVKRVAISPNIQEQKIESDMDKIFVRLKPRKEYRGKSFLALTNPKVKGGNLTGERRNMEVTIPLVDIDTIEVQRFDTKKSVIVSLGVITFAAVGSWIARGIGRANVD